MLTIPETTGFYFREMFTELDAQLSNLGIRSYNIRAASLEEVFLKIGSETGKFSNNYELEQSLRELRHGDAYDYKACVGERTCSSTLSAFCKLNLKTGWFTCISIAIIIPVLIVLGMAGVYGVTHYKIDVINMNDYPSIYNSVMNNGGSLTLPYNNYTILGSDESTAPLFDGLNSGTYCCLEQWDKSDEVWITPNNVPATLQQFGNSIGNSG